MARRLANYDFEKYETVVEDCSESIVKKPKDFIGHYYRGLARIKLEQNALATTDLRKALELNPNHIGIKQSLEKLLKENKY